MNISAAWDFIDSMMEIDYGYEVIFCLFVCFHNIFPLLNCFLYLFCELPCVWPRCLQYLCELQVVLTGLIDTLYDNMPCANKVSNSLPM